MAGVALRVTAEVLDLEALLALVVIGDAVTFVSEKFWEPASHTSLLWRPVEDLRLHLSEIVTWRAEGGSPTARVRSGASRRSATARERSSIGERSARATAGVSAATRRSRETNSASAD